MDLSYLPVHPMPGEQMERGRKAVLLQQEVPSIWTGWGEERPPPPQGAGGWPASSTLMSPNAKPAADSSVWDWMPARTREALVAPAGRVWAGGAAPAPSSRPLVLNRVDVAL